MPNGSEKICWSSLTPRVGLRWNPSLWPTIPRQRNPKSPPGQAIALWDGTPRRWAANGGRLIAWWRRTPSCMPAGRVWAQRPTPSIISYRERRHRFTRRLVSVAWEIPFMPRCFCPRTSTILTMSIWFLRLQAEPWCSLRKKRIP